MMYQGVIPKIEKINPIREIICVSIFAISFITGFIGVFVL